MSKLPEPLPEQEDAERKPQGWTRRQAIEVLGMTGLAAAAASSGIASASGDKAPEGLTLEDAAGELIQDHYKRMSPDEIAGAIERIEGNYKKQYGVDIKVDNAPPLDGVVFGYAINISRCKGYRDCVKACVKENNQSREPQIEYIRVLEIDRGTVNLEIADHYYDHEEVPAEGEFYLPVQCQQCDNPPCVRACPVQATWKEPDGIIVVDYNWCIGCRFCMAACPYWARRFNWKEPGLPADEINTDTHYLSNRPRPRGVVEKCTFCLHRTRAGRMPACQEACPTGARVFGNLLDPDSEIRYVLANKTVFRLKEELNTEPKFWFFTD